MSEDPNEQPPVDPAPAEAAATPDEPTTTLIESLFAGKGKGKGKLAAPKAIKIGSIFESVEVATRYVKRVASETGLVVKDDVAKQIGTSIVSLHDWPVVKARVHEALQAQRQGPA